MSKINYEVIVSQLKTELDTDCAISNRYGIVLASNIKEFAKDKIIPQKIIELISTRKSLTKELNLKEINDKFGNYKTFYINNSSFLYCGDAGVVKRDRLRTC